MRFLQAGFIFLFMLPALAMGQVSGFVESIGFENHYRPDCWTPMVITITPETSKTDFYQVHVKLQDMDRDLPIFTRTISITGASEGQNRQQKFRMYFVPPPTDGGLPDARDAGMTVKDLQDRLKVSLHTASGKWICDLPLTSSIINIDPKPDSWSHQRSTKLILAISDGRSKAIYQDNTAAGLLGVLEDVAMVTIHPRDLPENVLGYEAIDAIVWLDADPAQLRAGGDEKARALESYVRRGGKLVICQPAEWQKMLAFEDLLPVTIQGVEERNDLMPLRAMAQPPSSLLPEESIEQSDPFARLSPPFRFARAKTKSNAIVSEWITWKTASDVSPYIVRAPFGLGAVTWVAQDLGDPSLTRAKGGWIYVWNRVFDWKNSPLPLTNRTPPDLPIKKQYEPGFATDLGLTLTRGMDLQSKSAWLITLAVVFFIGYWIVAGPGAYTYLAARHKTHLSWFIFGACAVGATALTVLIVKLVLRGPPEVRHFSIVRVASDQPAQVISRFGLYIPRDGMQKIELRDAAPESVTSICALPIHPFFLSEVPAQNGPEYYVPIVDAASGQTASVSVPYRSTLKKFQATWRGDIPGAVQGSARLAQQGWIAGHITNGTGQHLRNIYIAFTYPGEGAFAGDWILYLTGWDSGVTLDLAREFNKNEDGSKDLPIGFTDTFKPDGRRKIRGKLALDWQPFWLSGIRGSEMNNTFDDFGSPFPRSLPMLSLFDRLPPAKNDRSQAAPNRIEILRRGGRGLDISPALSAGSLVVLAQADGPLPIPLDVEGDRIPGEGTILYQFVLPLDHSAVISTTQPASE